MRQSVHIGIIGDREPDRVSHSATERAIVQCAEYLGMDVQVTWLPTPSLGGTAALASFDGLWGAPGVYASSDGALAAIRYAREENVPYLGTCQGCQHAVLEFARNVLGRGGAAHAELQPDAPDRVIDAMSCSFAGEWRTVFIPIHARIYGYYRTEQSEELFTCTFGIHPAYRTPLDEHGFRIAGMDETGETRLLELEQNTFHVATFFQPQRRSTLEYPHPLVRAFQQHAAQRRASRS